MMKYLIIYGYPLVASLGDNVNTIATNATNEIDKVILSVVTLCITSGILVGFWKRKVGYSIVVGTIVLYILYLLIAPMISTIQMIGG